MTYDPLNFSKQLIKGRIAETLFEQMLRDTGNFTILAFGYENLLPELVHRQQDIPMQETMEIIRRAPDFAVINNNSHDVYLIEVKYMMQPTPEKILEVANKMVASWKPSFLFLATPDGFFFGKASDVIKNGGEIKALETSFVPEEIQGNYLKILNGFIVAGAPTNH